MGVGVEFFMDFFDILTGNILHRHVIHAVDFADIEDLDDVGMVEVRGDAGFIKKHGDEVFFLRKMREDALDGDFFTESSEALLLGQEEFCHPALGQLGEQSVFSK